MAETAFHSLDRAPNDGGDLCVRKSLVFAQDQRLTEIGRECGNCNTYGTLPLAQFRRLPRITLGGDGICGLQGEGGVASHPSEVITAKVGGNPKEPTGENRLRTES